MIKLGRMDPSAERQKLFTFLRDAFDVDPAQIQDEFDGSGFADWSCARREELAGYAAQFTPDGLHAQQMATQALVRVIGREAATLAFADIFHLMAWGFVAVLLIVPFCKTPAMNASGSLGH